MTGTSNSTARKRLAESQAEAQTVDEALAKLLYEDCYTTPWRDAPDLYRDIWLNKAAKVLAAGYLSPTAVREREAAAFELAVQQVVCEMVGLKNYGWHNPFKGGA